MNEILNNKCKYFKYFLECYFNQSVNYCELNNIIEEFNNSETLSIRREFLKEINLINLESNKEFIKEFIRTNGKRNMDIKKTDWLIDELSKKINSN